ncbi:MAG TPA: DUF3108 domain-containing protein [Vicinamibacterales bacterium]|nr:DUF3108 domain-containing protein [Vicinamibacterales bacterium]
MSAKVYSPDVLKQDTLARLRSLGAACAILAAIVLAVPASASQRPSAAPRREKPVPFAAGEKLSYEVSWSSYLTAGGATIHVAEKKPSYGSTAYYIVAEGRPTPLLSKLYSLYYKADTLLDVYSLLPQRGSVYSEEGKRRRMKTTMFEHPARRAEYQVETRSVVKKSVGISPAAQDPLGALFVLRSIPLQAGEKMTMPICDGGLSYKVLIQAGGTETVRTNEGEVAAQRLSITPPPESGANALSVWLSTDTARVPVKMSAQLPVGAFVLTLSSRR